MDNTYHQAIIIIASQIALVWYSIFGYGFVKNKRWKQ